MSFCQVDSIHVYPIKSAAGVQLSKAWLDDFGLAFDRRFVLSSIMGTFITARTEPKLCLINVFLIADGIVVNAPEMPSLTIKYQTLSDHYQNVDVWQTKINAQHIHRDIDKWFSQYLKKPCQLLFFGEQSTRYIENSTKQTGFADGYPLLLVSQASLQQLNEVAGQTFSMTQFRPNIVVDHCDAFSEDTWQNIRIGDVEFEVVKACERCIFTTIDPVTAIQHPEQEPLTSLKSFRQQENGEVIFGQNLIQLSPGYIKQGDKIDVLKTKAKAKPLLISSHKLPKKTVAYTPPASINIEQPKLKTTDSHSQPTQSNKADAPSSSSQCNIAFDSWNKTVNANKTTTILEQGENAGLILPYSCRGGMCGRCKLKLNNGEVKVLASDGLSQEEREQGYILSCSCIPVSNISVSKP